MIGLHKRDECLALIAPASHNNALASGVLRVTMKSLHLILILVVAILGVNLITPVAPVTADSTSPLHADALQAPPRRRLAGSSDNPTPDQYQPSTFLAGKVAVQIIFIESNGSYEPSTENWKPQQIAEIRQRVATALSWWAARLPQARLSFDLTSQVVPSGFEPIKHGLSSEGQWVGDTLNAMGVNASNYFEQAYAADEALRQARGTDWATTIFMVNSSNTSGGRFSDGHFAYAYINGPFMVVTSDAGPYGTRQLEQVVAHEFGHIFGALDQYASAGVPCSQESGYLAVPTTNSQSGNCGTKFVSIMLEPLSAYQTNQVDTSAYGQLGYRDNDNDAIPDPLDTAPALRIAIKQSSGSRPIISGAAVDQAYPSPTGELLSINRITAVEYRVDGGIWMPLPAADGAYDQVREQLAAALALYDGQHQVELRTINQIGAISPVLSYDLTVSGVGADPGYRVRAPALTSSQQVTLSLNAPAGAQVQLSESASFGNASWLAATETLSWQVGAAEGEHTIYARFRDANGLESATQRAEVTLDLTPPTGHAWLRKSGGGLWLEIQAQDARSAVAEMQVSAGADERSTWQPFQSEMKIGLQSDTIYVRLRDAAGNITEPIVASPVSPIWVPVASR